VHIETGALFFALAAAVLLAAATAWLVAGLYRRRMVALMRGGPAPDLAGAVAPASAGAPPGQPGILDLAANRRAALRQLLALAKQLGRAEEAAQYEQALGISASTSSTNQNHAH